MITLNGIRAFHTGCLIMIVLVSCPANAQSGVPFQLQEIQAQLVRIDAGVNNLGKTVDEIVLVERSRCDRPLSWNRKLPENERFVPALNGHAFCDLETGLVWEETPDAELTYWQFAIDDCRNREVDGRLGWHLPTVEELQSLIDGQNSYPALPSGHPFKGLGEYPQYFFTSTPTNNALYGFYRHVWAIDVGTGTAANVHAYPPPFMDAQERYWCVRGGANVLTFIDVNLEGDEVDPFPN